MVMSSGGSWAHSRQDGGRDLRYKNNAFIYYHAQDERTAAAYGCLSALIFCGIACLIVWVRIDPGNKKDDGASAPVAPVAISSSPPEVGPIAPTPKQLAPQKKKGAPKKP